MYRRFLTLLMMIVMILGEVMVIGIVILGFVMFKDDPL